MIKVSVLSWILKFVPYIIPFILGAGLIWVYHDYTEKKVIVDSLETVTKQQESYISEIDRIEKQRAEDEKRRQQADEDTPKDWLEEPADSTLIDVLSRLRGE